MVTSNLDRSGGEPHGGLARLSPFAVTRCGLLIVVAFFSLRLAGAVDQRPALSLGSYSVSHYLVEKFHGRFVNDLEHREHREPTAAETSAWLGRFFDQQVVIAYAGSLGYFVRPEVTGTVERMERHMLTQSFGPYYDEAIVPSPQSPQLLPELYRESLRQRSVLVVRFDARSPLLSDLGTDFDQLDAAAKTDRLLHFQGHAGIQVQELNSTWPFDPFSEAADAIAHAAIGEWAHFDDPVFGTYFILVRSVTPAAPQLRTRPMPSGFPAFAQHVARVVAIRRHRLEVLRAADFVFNPATASQVRPLWMDRSGSAAELPPPDTATAQAPLFHYTQGGSVVNVSVETYRRYFNQQFVRKVMHLPDDLREGAEDYVVAQVDLAAARDRGVDREPKFVEDRKGFTGFQVLDLYEKEKIVPTLSIDSAAIETYFRAHEADYARPTKVEGELLVFESEDAAIDWKQHHQASGAAPRREKLELAVDRPIASLEYLTQTLLTAPIGQELGPFRRGAGMVFFVKHANLAAESPPLAKLEPTIRALLIQERLVAPEHELARKVAGRFTINDQIAYSKFGVSTSQVEKPWRER